MMVLNMWSANNILKKRSQEAQNFRNTEMEHILKVLFLFLFFKILSGCTVWQVSSNSGLVYFMLTVTWPAPQMLISQMLQVNVDTRFTAEEVLSHPWVTVRPQTPDKTQALHTWSQCIRALLLLCVLVLGRGAVRVQHCEQPWRPRWWRNAGIGSRISSSGDQTSSLTSGLDRIPLHQLETYWAKHGGLPKPSHVWGELVKQMNSWKPKRPRIEERKQQNGNLTGFLRSTGNQPSPLHVAPKQIPLNLLETDH